MITFKQFLDEARARPDLNPRVTAYSTVAKYADKKGYFIHFATVPKLGIRPSTNWSTPLGLYGWTTDYWGDKYKDRMFAAGDPMERVTAYTALSAFKSLYYASRNETRFFMTHREIKDEDDLFNLLLRIGHVKKSLATVESNFDILKPYIKRLSHRLKNKDDLRVILKDLVVLFATGWNNFYVPSHSNTQTLAALNDIVAKSLSSYEDLAYGMQDIIDSTEDITNKTTLSGKDPFDIFPYAKYRDYVFIFKAKNPSKMLDTSKTYSLFEDERDAKKWAKKIVGEYKDADFAIEKTFRDNPSWWKGDGARVYSAIRYLIAHAIRGASETKFALLFSRAFEDLGFDGIMDNEKEPVVYAAEPGQAVIFRTKNLEIVEMVKNDTIIARLERNPNW